jgi:hypothetical protein
MAAAALARGRPQAAADIIARFCALIAGDRTFAASDKILH